MTDKNWQDEELWIVTASSSDNGSKQGMKAVRGNGNPYSPHSAPQTVPEGNYGDKKSKLA
jgi:hypothetical protein